MLLLMMLTRMGWSTCTPVPEKPGHFTVGPGAATCRQMDLGDVEVVQISALKAVVKQPDDSRSRFGLERVHRVGHRWVLFLPELRAGDRLFVDFDTEAQVSDPIWREAIKGTLNRQVHRIHRTHRFSRGADGMQFGADGGAVLDIEVTVEEEATAGGRTVWIPEGAKVTRCDAHVGDSAIQKAVTPWGCGVVVPEGLSGNLVWTYGWTEQKVSSAGEVDLRQPFHVDESTLHVTGVQIAAHSLGVEWKIDGQDAWFKAHDVSPTGDPQSVSWRVVTADGAPVLPSREEVVSQVAQGALAASIPEPGLGLQFKDLKGDAAAVGLVLNHVRRQVRVGRLPQTHPLKPRPLMQVRRSRWATPWEQSLLLTRYLRQLKIDAVPYPVRPMALGDAEAAAPIGYTGAVVRVGEGTWIDPSCAVCAIGEISPELWGGQVLSEDLERLPPTPASEESVTEKDGRVNVRLAGPEAVRVRRWLAELPLDQRGGALAARFGGPGAVLEQHRGLTTHGAVIALVVLPDQSRK